MDLVKGAGGMTRNGRHSPADCERLVSQAAQVVVQSDFVVAVTAPPGLRGLDDTSSNGFDPTHPPPAERFEADPEHVRQWAARQRERLKPVTPTPTHCALTELERIMPKFVLITETIDGLHQKAGAKNTIELHGNLWIDRCARCDYHKNVRELDGREESRCPHCGEWLQPGVTRPNEAVPAHLFRAALEAADRCKLILSTGISQPRHAIPSLLCQAKAGRAIIIEINPEPTVVSPVADLRLTGPADALLPQLVDSVKRLSHPGDT